MKKQMMFVFLMSILCISVAIAEGVPERQKTRIEPEECTNWRVDVPDDFDFDNLGSTGKWEIHYYTDTWNNYSCEPVPNKRECYLGAWLTGWKIFAPDQEIGPPSEIGPTDNSLYFDHIPEINSEGMFY